MPLTDRDAIWVVRSGSYVTLSAFLSMQVVMQSHEITITTRELAGVQFQKLQPPKESDYVICRR
jgi:hypothetical protein